MTHLEVEIRRRKRQRRRKRGDTGRHPAVTRTQIQSGRYWVSQKPCIIINCIIESHTCKFTTSNLQCCRSIPGVFSGVEYPVLGEFRIQGSVPLPKGYFLNCIWMTILDDFKSLPNYLCQTSSVSPGIRSEYYRIRACFLDLGHQWNVCGSPQKIHIIEVIKGSRKKCSSTSAPTSEALF